MGINQNINITVILDLCDLTPIYREFVQPVQLFKKLYQSYFCFCEDWILLKPLYHVSSSLIASRSESLILYFKHNGWDHHRSFVFLIFLVFYCSSSRRRAVNAWMEKEVQSFYSPKPKRHQYYWNWICSLLAIKVKKKYYK